MIMESQYTLSELTDILRNSRFVIYGAGFQAHRLYKCLIKMNLSDHVISFAVTSLSNQTVSKIDNKEIRRISDIFCNEKVLIAAHNESAGQMRENLIKLGFTDFIVMHPYLSLLEFGEPFHKNYSVNINGLLREMPPIYYVTVIYLAIENYFEKNNIGDQLYIKMQSKYADIDSAKNRLKALHEKIKVYSPQVAEDDFNIRLSSDNIIIDGNHRTALAKYFGIACLKADVYHATMDDYVETLDEAVFTIEELEKIYNKDELNLILETNKKLRTPEE